MILRASPSPPRFPGDRVRVRAAATTLTPPHAGLLPGEPFTGIMTDVRAFGRLGKNRGISRGKSIPPEQLFNAEEYF